jgi:branched-chain amino acid transport system permease protein
MPPLSVIIQQLFNGLMLGVMYALIAVGFTLFFGVLNVIHFSHGDVYMLGAFAALSLTFLWKSLGISHPAVALLLTFLGAMGIIGTIGLVAERACVKPLSKSPPLITLLATLMLGLCLREAILVFYPRGADPKSFPSMLPAGLFEVGGVVIRYDNLMILAIGVGVIVVVDRIINGTRMGTAIRAVAQDAEAAQMMGVDLDRTVDFTFFLGSALAAVAGILNGLYYSEIMFTMGIMGGIIGFSAAAIGGFGNIYGAIVGGLLFGILQTQAAAFIPRGSEFRDVVAFAVVMLFLVFKPTGILGEKVTERV